MGLKYYEVSVGSLRLAEDNKWVLQAQGFNTVADIDAYLDIDWLYSLAELKPSNVDEIVSCLAAMGLCIPKCRHSDAARESLKVSLKQFSESFDQELWSAA